MSNKILQTIIRKNKTFHILEIPHGRFTLNTESGNKVCLTGSGTLTFAIGRTNYSIEIASSHKPPNDRFCNEKLINRYFLSKSGSYYILVGAGPTWQLQE